MCLGRANVSYIFLYMAWNGDLFIHIRIVPTHLDSQCLLGQRVGGEGGEGMFPSIPRFCYASPLHGMIMACSTALLLCLDEGLHQTTSIYIYRETHAVSHKPEFGVEFSSDPRFGSCDRSVACLVAPSF